MNKEITSVNNSLIKELYQLKVKSKARKKTGQFLIEGQREISLALKGGYQISYLLFNPNILGDTQLPEKLDTTTTLVEVTNEVYEKLAYRDSTQGMIAVGSVISHNLNSIQFSSKNPLLLIAEAPEKPGNIGALLRTADAANVDAVIIANPKTDLYNPNIIRSSVGCIFTNNIAMGSTSDIVEFLKSNKVNIYCASLQAKSDYHLQDFTKPTAIVVGTEATGLSDEWIQNSTENIIIPMQGEIDSMNVSVAAGILIFEAKRQRNFR